MKKENYSEKSTEELKKTLKTLNFSTGMLAGILIVLFVSSIVVYKELGPAMIAVPLALSSIVFINLGTIKIIKAELKSRG
jgi:hypothetical protein